MTGNCRWFELAAAAVVGAAAAVVLSKVQRAKRTGRYYAGMIKANPELIDQYKQLHDATWDEVMERMHKSNIRDFVVWLHEETNTMFHQFIYVGDSFEEDMAAIEADPIVRFWWTHCEPCQVPLHWDGPPPSQGGQGHTDHPGQWWAPLTQVNHCGGWSVEWSDSWPHPNFTKQHPRGLTSTKDNPPAVHNRNGAAKGWTSWKQSPFDIRQ